MNSGEGNKKDTWSAHDFRVDKVSERLLFLYLQQQFMDVLYKEKNIVISRRNISFYAT